MGVVELLDAGLRGVQTAESFLEAVRGGIRSGSKEDRAWNAELRGALALNAIEMGVERADVVAKKLLMGDAGLEAIDIERDNVGACSDEGIGERAEQGNALFEEFEKACGFGSHDLGPFVELMFFFFVDLEIHARRRRSAVKDGLRLSFLQGTLVVRVLFFPSRKRLYAGWT